jgi:hypothetical protein
MDTGNLQGNFVSKSFVDTLGITETDFKPLRPPEKGGGTSVTGHTLVPIAAVYLTWYASSSPKLYSGMRFLVLPDISNDLIIGARSILKHQMIAVPNLTLPKAFEQRKTK